MPAIQVRVVEAKPRSIGDAIRELLANAAANCARSQRPEPRQRRRTPRLMRGAGSNGSVPSRPVHWTSRLPVTLVEASCGSAKSSRKFTVVLSPCGAQNSNPLFGIKKTSGAHRLL